MILNLFLFIVAFGVLLGCAYLAIYEGWKLWRGWRANQMQLKEFEDIITNSRSWTGEECGMSDCWSWSTTEGEPMNIKTWRYRGFALHSRVWRQKAVCAPEIRRSTC